LLCKFIPYKEGKMEQNKKQGRTLQDYAHLFLSRNQERNKTETTPQAAPAADRQSPEEQGMPDGRPAADEITGPHRLDVSGNSSQEEAYTTPPEDPGRPAKVPYAIALCCPDRPLANSFLTFNLCIDCVREDLQVLVINADLSFPSMNYLSSLQPQIIAGRAEPSRRRNPLDLQVVTLDMDITVLNSPWADEQNPIIAEISESARNADIILINTALGFSANAKALFKSADEAIVIAGIEPSQLINAYSTIKLIYQIAPQPRISVIMAGPEDEALRGFKKMQEAAQQFLGRELSFCGSFPWDADVTNSIMQKKALPGDCAAARHLREVSGQVLGRSTRQQQGSESRESGFIEKLFVTSGQSMGEKYDTSRQQRWRR
jgi:MinD-like ATPase involved in chromosome partitioning or flagellar assembly